VAGAGRGVAPEAQALHRGNAAPCPIHPTVPEVDMQTVKFVHWQDGDAFFGYQLDYPDYWTQGDSLDDLKDHLIDLYQDLTSGELPAIRKVDELVVP
jgi:hypothetical protein